jgi:ElaB/YqjD/DUF883 family membrane-anchored ribosome-binding protein
MSEIVTTGKLIEDLQVVVRDAEALLQATAAQGGEKIEALRARAGESLQAARRRLAVAEKQVREEARQAAAAADDYVHANPWQAVGVAAGVGLLLGLLIGRR